MTKTTCQDVNQYFNVFQMIYSYFLFFKALRDFKELSKKYRKAGENDESSTSDADPYIDESIHEDEIAMDTSGQCELQESNSSDEHLRKRRKS